MAVKTNLRVIIKNRAADPKIGFLTKSIFKPYGRAVAMPTAWELMNQTKADTNLYYPHVSKSPDIKIPASQD